MADDQDKAPTGDNLNPEQKAQAAAGAGEAGKGSSEAPSWRDKLTDPLKSHTSLAKFKADDTGLSALAQSYTELEGKLGRSITIPGKDAKPEEWEKLFSRLGRPQTADDYALEAIEGFEPDQAFLTRLRSKCHSGGFTPAQTALVHRFIAEENMAGESARREARAQAFNEAQAALRSEWGPRFDERLELARRFVVQRGGDAAMAYLEEMDLTNDPVLLRLLAAAGEATGPHKFVEGTDAKGKSGPYPYMNKK